MTILNYWIEETDRVWIKVPSIPENGSITISVKKTGDYSPDGDETFILFDDFPGSSLDTDKWEFIRGSGDSVSGGILTLYRTTISTKDLSFGRDTAVVVKHRIINNATYRHTRVGYNAYRDDLPDNAVFYAKYMGSTNRFRTRLDGGDATNEDGWSSSSTANFNVVDIHRYSSDKAYIKELGTDNDATITTEIPTIDMPIGLSARAGTVSSTYTEAEFDYVFVRKVVEDEPSISVTDQTTHYDVTINNTGGDELTDYQISVDASDLGTLANDESLEVERL